MSYSLDQAEPAFETPVSQEVAFGEHLAEHQAKYFAHELERSYANDHVGKLAGLLFEGYYRATG